jgi:trans-aconitate methyltransferase
MNPIDFPVEQYNTKNFDQYFQQSRHEMLKYIPDTAKFVLDIGCSNGNFGELLKKRSKAEVWGVEPNHSAAESASTKLDKVLYCLQRRVGTFC